MCTWAAVASWPCSPHWECEKGELRIRELCIQELPLYFRTSPPLSAVDYLAVNLGKLAGDPPPGNLACYRTQHW